MVPGSRWRYFDLPTRLLSQAWPADSLRSRIIEENGIPSFQAWRVDTFRGALRRSRRRAIMPEENTTAIVQRYLDELTGEAPAEPVVRPLLDRAFLRLQRLCATLLHHDYPRLKHPPLNLQTDELLSAVVERLLKALREARPRTVREFFALAGQHMRWELNDLARRLDKRPRDVKLREGEVLAPASSESGL